MENTRSSRSSRSSLLPTHINTRTVAVMVVRHGILYTVQLVSIEVYNTTCVSTHQHVIVMVSSHRTVRVRTHLDTRVWIHLDTQWSSLHQYNSAHTHRGKSFTFKGNYYKLSVCVQPKHEWQYTNTNFQLSAEPLHHQPMSESQLRRNGHYT